MSGETTVTIKGNGSSAPWLVLRGAPADVKQQIIDTFGFDDTVQSLTLSDLTVYATSTFQGIGNVAAKLGAVLDVTATVAANETPASTDQPATAAPPWDPPAAAAEPAAPQDPLLAAIAAATGLEAIQKLWLSNQAEFTRPEVQEAVVARRAELGVA